MDFSDILSLQQRHAPIFKRGLRFAAGLALVAGIVLAIIVSQVDFVGAERAALARLEAETGFKVSFASRAERRFPAPRVQYERVEVHRRNGALLFSAARADLGFDLIDLFDGKLDAPALTLVGAQASLEESALSAPFASPRALIDLLEAFIDAFEKQAAFGALKLRFEDVNLKINAPGRTSEVGPLMAGVEFSSAQGRLQARVTQAGSGAPGASVPLNQLQFKLALVLPTRAALAGGRAEPARVDAQLGDSQLAFSGKARMEQGLTLAGSIDAVLAQAFERLVGWQGGVRDASRLSAAMTLDARGLGLDGLKLVLGGRGVTGIASLREVGTRWNLSATLGGDLVDGTAAYRVVQGIRDEKGAWSRAPLSLNPLPALDLDVRLSTKAFRLGRFALSQVALSVLTRPGRTEMAILDSRFGNGTFKARVNLAEAGNGLQNLRLSLLAEGVEGGELLDQALGFDRITGNGGFVLQAQGQGNSVAGLVAGLNGTAAFDLSDGIINGIDLNRLMVRAATQRAETALLFSLVGKTAFQALRADFAIQNGRLDTVGSRFLTPGIDALMEGYSDLAAQQHHQSLVLRKRDEGGQAKEEFFAFRLEGSLLSPSVKPDNKLVQETR